MYRLRWEIIQDSIQETEDAGIHEDTVQSMIKILLLMQLWKQKLHRS